MKSCRIFNERSISMKQMTLLSAAIDFFGLRDGQSRMEFAKLEWKALSDADKAEVKTGLEKNGYEIVSA